MNKNTIEIKYRLLTTTTIKNIDCRIRKHLVRFLFVPFYDFVCCTSAAVSLHFVDRVFFWYFCVHFSTLSSSTTFWAPQSGLINEKHKLKTTLDVCGRWKIFAQQWNCSLLAFFGNKYNSCTSIISKLSVQLSAEYTFWEFVLIPLQQCTSWNLGIHWKPSYNLFLPFWTHVLPLGIVPNCVDIISKWATPLKVLSLILSINAKLILSIRYKLRDCIFCIV